MCKCTATPNRYNGPTWFLVTVYSALFFLTVSCILGYSGVLEKAFPPSDKPLTRDEIRTHYGQYTFEELQKMHEVER